MYKCAWLKFIDGFSPGEAKKFKFFKLWNKKYSECLEPGFLYIGVRLFKFEKGDIIQGIGAPYCKKHAPMVLTVINRINSKTKRYEPNDIEIMVLG